MATLKRLAIAASFVGAVGASGSVFAQETPCPDSSQPGPGRSCFAQPTNPGVVHNGGAAAATSTAATGAVTVNPVITTAGGSAAATATTAPITVNATPTQSTAQTQTVATGDVNQKGGDQIVNFNNKQRYQAPGVASGVSGCVGTFGLSFPGFGIGVPFTLKDCFAEGRTTLKLGEDYSTAKGMVASGEADLKAIGLATLNSIEGSAVKDGITTLSATVAARVQNNGGRDVAVTDSNAVGFVIPGLYVAKPTRVAFEGQAAAPAAPQVQVVPVPVPYVVPGAVTPTLVAPAAAASASAAAAKTQPRRPTGPSFEERVNRLIDKRAQEAGCELQCVSKPAGGAASGPAPRR